MGYAVVLILLSAFLHAGWNLLCKSSDQNPKFYIGVNIVVMLLSAPFAALHPGDMKLIFENLYLAIILSGLCQGIYVAGLFRAYRTNDISISYPLIRAVPVLAVGTIGVFLFKAVNSAAYYAGLVLVFSGISYFSLLQWRKHSSVRWVVDVVIASAGTVGYSLIDFYGVRKAGAIALSGSVVSTGIYFFLSMVVCVGFLAVFCAVTNPGIGATGISGGRIAITGLMTWLSYGLVVYAMTLHDRLGAIMALRQFSIPLGILAAALFMKERPGYTSVIAGSVVTAGIVLVNL
jgi:drug/metabolite transporter (DMT)-like permease